jgi:hypothetical protein
MTVVRLFDANGNTIEVENNEILSPTQSAVISAGYDSINNVSRFVNLDGYGNIYSRNLYGNINSYMASTNGSVSSGTSSSTITSIAYLFHTSFSTKRIEINRIDITSDGGTNGSLCIRGAFITAENGTPGGTSQTINSTDRGQVSNDSTDIFRTGANNPTRVSGDLFSTMMGSISNNVFSWQTPAAGKPIILQTGFDEGFEIRTVVETSYGTAAQVSVMFYWTES